MGVVLGSGLSTRMEATWAAGDWRRERGIPLRQCWWQNSLQRITSLVSHLISGEWMMSQGRPRMRSTVASSRTRNTISSSCKFPIRSLRGGVSNLTQPRPSGFPLMVSTRSSRACHWRGRWRRSMRSWEMKLPEEPESTEAEAAMDWTEVSSCIISTVSLAMIGSVWSILTAGCRSLTGQARI